MIRHVGTVRLAGTTEWSENRCYRGSILTIPRLLNECDGQGKSLIAIRWNDANQLMLEQQVQVLRKQGILNAWYDTHATA